MSLPASFLVIVVLAADDAAGQSVPTSRDEAIAHVSGAAEVARARRLAASVTLLGLGAGAFGYGLLVQPAERSERVMVFSAGAGFALMATAGLGFPSAVERLDRRLEAADEQERAEMLAQLRREAQRARRTRWSSGAIISAAGAGLTAVSLRPLVHGERMTRVDALQMAGGLAVLGAGISHALVPDDLEILGNALPALALSASGAGISFAARF
jgi:hypothetical protein